MERDVNDRALDVALHLVFKNKAAYDQYEKGERHLRFIEENRDYVKISGVKSVHSWSASSTELRLT
jgi:hypothetical protein